MAGETEVLGSQELRTEIAKDPNRTNHQFTRDSFIASVKHFGHVEISDSDIPPFDGTIFFTSEQYIAFIENLEKKSQMDEKKAIISEAVKKQTQTQTDSLKASFEAQKNQMKEIFTNLPSEKIVTSFAVMKEIISICPDKYKTLLQGYAGSLILEQFENNGQQIVLKSGNKLEVNSINASAQDNVELELRLNTLIQSGNLDTNVLKTGMLYRAETFGSYSASIRGQDGKVMTPDSAKYPNQYFIFLRDKMNKGYKISSAEQTLLDSQDSFRVSSPDMISAIEQMKDLEQYKKRVEVSMNSLVSAPPSGNTGPQSGSNIPTAIGGIAGVLGGTGGKIIGAGTNGTINFVTDMINGASKESPLGGVVVIGALIAAMWSDKIGFWKTLGALFGIGILNEVSAGRLDLDFGKDGKDKKNASKKADTSKPTEGTKSSPEAKNIPTTDTAYTSFLTTSAGFAAENIQESKTLLAQFDNLTYSDIEAFIKEGEGKITTGISAVLGDKTNPEYAQKKAALEKYIKALTATEGEGGGFGNVIEKIKQKSDYATWTMKQVQEYIFNVKERAAEVVNKAEELAKKATTPEDAAAAKQLGADATEAAKNGDVEGVHWYSSITSWLSDNIANIVVYGSFVYWLNNIKATDKTWRTTNWFVFLRDKTKELVKKGAKGISPKWMSGGKAPTSPELVADKTSESVVIKKTPNINQSILEIEGLTGNEKKILESVIEKTERIDSIHNELLLNPKDSFKLLAEKNKLGGEIEELMVKIAQTPKFIIKLETAGKTSTEIAEFVMITKTATKTATKAEVVGLIPKIIKIFKKV